jgi:hypothetical protein
MNKPAPKMDEFPFDDPEIAFVDSDSIDFDDPNLDPAFRAAVLAGLADLDAGRSIPYEEVRKWVLSWGTDNELPPPECP